MVGKIYQEESKHMWYLSDAEENRRGFWERFPIIPLFIPGPMGSLHQVNKSPRPLRGVAGALGGSSSRRRLCAFSAGPGLLAGIALLGCSEWGPCFLNLLSIYLIPGKKTMLGFFPSSVVSPKLNYFKSHAVYTQLS